MQILSYDNFLILEQFTSLTIHQLLDSLTCYASRTRFRQLNYRCLPVIYRSTHSQDQLQPVGNSASYRFVKVTQSCKSRIGSGPSLVLGKIVAHGQKAARRVDVGRGWLTGCRLLTEDALPLSLRLYLPSLLPSILILSLSLFPSLS